VFLELVDALRCPNDHEDTWLVAAIDELRGRHIVRGSLGCPACKAHYPILAGEADFTGGAPRPGAGGPAPAPGPDDVLRMRALLGLSDPGGVVALVGRGAAYAAPLEAESQCTLLVVNPAGVRRDADLSALRVAGRLPLAPLALRAALLGDADHPAAFVASVVGALRHRGRLVAPATLPVPEGVSELARDARHWVAERTAVRASPPQPLRRG
jgi:uncharacterized protein YbaR (Trm112 family)